MERTEKSGRCTSKEFDWKREAGPGTIYYTRKTNIVIQLATASSVLLARRFLEAWCYEIGTC
jgi:hypothetical protein